MRRSLSLPLSSSCYLYSPCHYCPCLSLSSFLLLLSVIFCLSQLLPCLSLLPLFLPYLLHLSVVSFSSPLSLPLQSNCTEVIHLSHVLAVTTSKPVFPQLRQGAQTVKLWWNTSALSFVMALVLLLSEVPNYLNVNLNLVPALWLLLTLRIHFY